MMSLKDALVDAADDARVYDVTDRAVRVVQRRRTLTRLVPVAAALLVVAGLVGVAWPLSDGGGQEPSTAADGLPRQLTLDRSAPVLPEDRGVGPAALAFAYDDGDQGRWALLAADGRQYKVDGLRVDGMSPDGRWLLVLRSEGSWVLRDLTGTARQEFAGVDTSAGASWSPDSRRLVVQTSSRSGVTYTVDLTTGARGTAPPDLPRTARVCAVRNSGELLLCPLPESSFSGLRLADGTTGRIVRDIPTTDLGLRPTETVPESFGAPILDTDDRTLFMRTHDAADPGSAVGQNTFLVGFDLETGRLTHRYPLPDDIPGAQRPANGGFEHGQPDARYVLGVHPEGPLLLHLAPSGTDPFHVGSVTIELIARDTGTLRTVTRASAPIGLIRYPG
ncbi:hypothetical protein [Dactylosporangium sp. NPDC050588]|uniref:hypothetical protein n=1 Tax=Dactylosporangium sp. NPDC050588 TaxID=3157211 RepID=UPI0033DC5BDA